MIWKIGIGWGIIKSRVFEYIKELTFDALPIYNKIIQTENINSILENNENLINKIANKRIQLILDELGF